jgi:hypothetical protein
MTLLFEILSVACAICIIALGFSLLQRSHGVVILETFALGVGVVLFLFSLVLEATPSTLHAGTLVSPLIITGVILALIPRWYATWRMRMAGEPTILILSFSIMNTLLLTMSVLSRGRSVPLSFASTGYVTKWQLELLLTGLSIGVLAAAVFLLSRHGFMAAVQLSQDDDRFLRTFGRDAIEIKRKVLGVAASLCTIGMFVFIVLQENFAVVQSDVVLVPAFAVAISQQGSRIVRLFLTSVLLAGAERILVLQSSELLRQFHQGVLFALLVFGSMLLRELSESGLLEVWGQHLHRLQRTVRRDYD